MFNPDDLTIYGNPFAGREPALTEESLSGLAGVRIGGSIPMLPQSEESPAIGHVQNVRRGEGGRGIVADLVLTPEGERLMTFGSIVPEVAVTLDAPSSNPNVL